MNPRCVAVPPNVALPGANVLRPFNALTSGSFSRFRISALTWTDFAPKWKSFAKDASTLCCSGVRSPVIVRGALPNVNAAAWLNAAGLSQRADG